MIRVWRAQGKLILQKLYNNDAVKYQESTEGES